MILLLNEYGRTIFLGLVILVVVIRVCQAFRGDARSTDQDNTPPSSPPGGDTHV